jgi:metal-sulfur cluster biosynthetic enzyme
LNDPVELRAAIMSRLAEVVDPETGVDVVRMRLIETLTVDAQGWVAYTFRPSSPLCPLAVPLAMEIRRAVREVPGVSRQVMRVEGYSGSDELNALLNELADEA